MRLMFPLPRALPLALLILVAACDSVPADPAEISPAAQAYLEEVMGVMEAHSLNRFTIDWPTFRSEVFGVAAGAQTVPDTYPAITRALRLLGDDHSRFRTIEGLVLSGADIQCAALIAEDPQLPASIGYVRLRSLPYAMDPAAYVGDVQSMIEAFDGEDLIGWVVDLRGNSGGDMWAMLAAVGPVLGEDVVGHFIDAEGRALPWEYRDGASWLDGTEMYRVPDPYALHHPRPRVAVLMDNRTTSSGEAMAIAFRERPGTRSFGQDTCGLTTGTRPFIMSDGAILDLAFAIMADRTGTEYGGFIAPDQLGAGVFQPVELAIDWLESGS